MCSFWNEIMVLRAKAIAFTFKLIWAAISSFSISTIAFLHSSRLCSTEAVQASWATLTSALVFEHFNLRVLHDTQDLVPLLRSGIRQATPSLLHMSHGSLKTPRSFSDGALLGRPWWVVASSSPPVRQGL